MNVANSTTLVAGSIEEFTHTLIMVSSPALTTGLIIVPAGVPTASTDVKSWLPFNSFDLIVADSIP